MFPCSSSLLTPFCVFSTCSQVGLRHKINDNLMIYPGYVPREGIEPILLHYGLPFSVGNWSFNKLAHHEDDIVYDCNRLFPEPPYPREVCQLVGGNLGPFSNCNYAYFLKTEFLFCWQANIFVLNYEYYKLDVIFVDSSWPSELKF